MLDQVSSVGRVRGDDDVKRGKMLESLLSKIPPKLREVPLLLLFVVLGRCQSA